VKHGKQSNPNFQILLTNRGYHCGYTEAYTWKVAGETIRSLFVARSPELKKIRKLVTRPLKFVNMERPFPELNSSRPRLKLQWRTEMASNKLTLVQDFSDWCVKRQGCLDGLFHSQVAPEVVQSEFKGLPLNDVESQVHTRWSNANLFVSGQYLGFLDNREQPVSVSWYSYNSHNASSSGQPEFDLIKGQKLAPAFDMATSRRMAEDLYSEGLEKVLKINE
jgi:hypothetical protein